MVGGIQLLKPDQCSEEKVGQYQSVSEGNAKTILSVASPSAKGACTKAEERLKYFIAEVFIGRDTEATGDKKLKQIEKTCNLVMRRFESFADSKQVKVSSVIGAVSIVIYCPHEQQKKERTKIIKHLKQYLSEGDFPILKELGKAKRLFVSTLNHVQAPITFLSQNQDYIYGKLDNKIGKLDNMITKLKNKIDNMITKLDNKITKLKNKIDNMITKLDNKITKLKNKIDKIGSQIFISAVVISLP